MLEVDCSVRRGSFALEASFRSPMRGVTALFGRSGAGKSTLLAAIAGLLTPERGRIVFEGAVLLDTAARINVAAQDRAFGYVFQEARLFPHYRVAGNLRYGLSRARGRQVRVAYDTVVSLLGLTSLLERRVHTLSGGERQRVALGRALLFQPRALLLDEPLASLDAARKDEVLPYLERLRHELGIPMVYVSHSFDEVLRLADQVVVLERGSVAAAASLQRICIDPALRDILGEGVVGTVLEGEVLAARGPDGLARVRCGTLELRVHRLPEHSRRVRIYVPAEDVVLARERPRAISTRNVLELRVAQIEPSGGSLLIHLDAGDTRLIARITHSAASELQLATGMECFALLKAVTTQGRRLDRREPERT
jgi:molybdate transport system ATP-binding protein